MDKACIASSWKQAVARKDNVRGKNDNGRRKTGGGDVHVVAFVPFHILSAEVTCSVFTSLNYPHVHCNQATMSNFNYSIPHMIVFNITHLYTRSYHHVHLSFAEEFDIVCSQKFLW